MSASSATPAYGPAERSAGRDEARDVLYRNSPGPDGAARLTQAWAMPR